MTTTYLTVLGACVAFVLYTYFGYPAALWLLSRLKPAWSAPSPPDVWPFISVTVPAFNEAGTIRGTIESLLALEYPTDRRQILIVSDASTDGTDTIVREYADRGVELHRVDNRGGKTAAENAARHALRGEIIVNTDASVRVHPNALRRLVVCFGDPSVGVASGRDISVAADDEPSNVGEKGYVGYEMWVRSLETRVGGIVQASGCLYATRKEIHDRAFPEHLTRDYGAVALSREAGMKAVSVDEALCYVPRQRSLKKEYRRKVRTMTRGLKTVWYRRRLLNPLRFGLYSWMVFSHKVCRWLVPVAMLLGVIATAGLATLDPRFIAPLLLGLAVIAMGVVGWLWPAERPVPKALAVPAFVLIANLAALNGWLNLFRGKDSAAWSPTRRPDSSASDSARQAIG